MANKNRRRYKKGKTFKKILREKLGVMIIILSLIHIWFGGDEFFILIEADYDRPQINQYMDRFIDNFTHWATIPISCSAGIAFIRDGAPSYQKILSLADEALYRSKQNGKNQYNYAEEKS